MEMALIIVRKVFKDAQLSLDGDIHIDHDGKIYGVRAGRYKNLSYVGVGMEEISIIMANDIIKMTVSEIISPN